MSEESSVVVGVDGSEHSLRALGWALSAARGIGAPLLVAHVRSDALQLGSARIASLGGTPEIPDTVADGVRSWVERHGAQVSVRYLSLDGTVTDALLPLCRDARLLVIGSRGHGGFATLLLGSTSRALAASAACPVVVVPHEARTVSLESGAGAGRVLLGLHTEETADDVIDFAFRAAAQRGVALEAVTAFRLPASPAMLVGPPAPALQMPPQMAMSEATELVAETERRQAERLRPGAERYPDVEVVADVAPADAAGRLVEASRTAGLVVVGRHRHRPRMESLLMGSVTHAVLHHAHCPVAVVPAATAPH
ncbi:universal stress protein [Streptomyces sp. NPDC059442]|uniref:universal stress protein n=1 Tax=unclassified Streptomyces TaxID=2593676 RepID=UPI0036B2A07F